MTLINNEKDKIDERTNKALFIDSKGFESIRFVEGMPLRVRIPLMPKFSEAIYKSDEFPRFKTIDFEIKGFDKDKDLLIYEEV